MLICSYVMLLTSYINDDFINVTTLLQWLKWCTYSKGSSSSDKHLYNTSTCTAVCTVGLIDSETINFTVTIWKKILQALVQWIICKCNQLLRRVVEGNIIA